MNDTPKAAIHLGNDHDVNLRNGQNSSWRTTGQLFGSGQTETTGINLIDSQDLRWISTNLLHSRAYQYANAKVYVFSDSVLCLGRIGDNPVGSKKKKIEWYSETNFFSELHRIEMESRWSSSGRFSQDSRQRVFSRRFRKTMGELQCDPPDFQDRFVFMSMFNDIVQDAKGNEKLM